MTEQDWLDLKARIGTALAAHTRSVKCPWCGSQVDATDPQVVQVYGPTNVAGNFCNTECLRRHMSYPELGYKSHLPLPPLPNP